MPGCRRSRAAPRGARTRGELPLHEADRPACHLQDLQAKERHVQLVPPHRRLEQRQQREQLAVEVVRSGQQLVVALQLAHDLLPEAHGLEIARRPRQGVAQEDPVDRQLPAVDRHPAAVLDQVVEEELVAEELTAPGGVVGSAGCQGTIEPRPAIAAAQKGRFEKLGQRLAVDGEARLRVQQIGNRDHDPELSLTRKSTAAGVAASRRPVRAARLSRDPSRRGGRRGGSKDPWLANAGSGRLCLTPDLYCHLPRRAPRRPLTRQPGYPVRWSRPSRRPRGAGGGRPWLVLCARAHRPRSAAGRTR